MSKKTDQRDDDILVFGNAMVKRDDDILVQGKSNKRKVMNREVPNRPNTQEGAVTSFYIKKKRNI